MGSVPVGLGESVSRVWDERGSGMGVGWVGVGFWVTFGVFALDIGGLGTRNGILDFLEALQDRFLHLGDLRRRLRG